MSQRHLLRFAGLQRILTNCLGCRRCLHRVGCSRGRSILTRKGQRDAVGSVGIEAEHTNCVLGLVTLKVLGDRRSGRIPVDGQGDLSSRLSLDQNQPTKASVFSQNDTTFFMYLM